MSRSKKKIPISTICCCKSQKKGKRVCSRLFRHKSRILLNKGKDHLLPIKHIEVTDPWDLGGDGKTFYGNYPEEEWFVKLMRK